MTYILYLIKNVYNNFLNKYFVLFVVDINILLIQLGTRKKKTQLSNSILFHIFQSSKAKMIHLADLFSVPEMGLMCNVAEFFIKNNIDYHPAILFLDVKVIYKDLIF